MLAVAQGDKTRSAYKVFPNPISAHLITMNVKQRVFRSFLFEAVAHLHA